jgi:tetratricopeptide (TPR) repeat protein
MFLPLILASILGMGAVQAERDLVRVWSANVRAHQPGKVDKPLLDVAALSPTDFETIRRAVSGARKRETAPVTPSRNPEDRLRNDLLRRGALVHTDIALLLPQRAATYVETRVAHERFMFDEAGTPRVLSGQTPGAVIFALDGESVATGVETAHWEMARRLLDAIAPHPAADEFVRLWYRGIAAHFEASNFLGSARTHLTRALAVLPDDPMLLFYAGAMHEVYASERVQSVLNARPGLASQLHTPPSDDEWRLAEHLFEQAVKANAPVEARLRYARVLAQLGKHEQAVVILRDIEPVLTTPRLRYLGTLFLGTEEGAVGRIAQAREAFERAASFFPTAQSPLMGLSELFRRSGDRAAALGVLERIHRLPIDAKSRVDPWTDYFRSYAHDAAAQLAAVREWFDRAKTE